METSVRLTGIIVNVTRQIDELQKALDDAKLLRDALQAYYAQIARPLPPETGVRRREIGDIFIGTCEARSHSDYRRHYTIRAYFQGSRSRIYYTCSCLAWTYSRGENCDRPNCKHIWDARSDASFRNVIDRFVREHQSASYRKV